MEAGMEGNILEGFPADDQGLELGKGREEGIRQAELNESVEEPNSLSSTGIISQLVCQPIYVKEGIADCNMSDIEVHTVSKDESNVTNCMYLNYHASDLEVDTFVTTNSLDAGTRSGEQKGALPMKEIQREGITGIVSFEACKGHAANPSTTLIEGQQFHMLDASIGTAEPVTSGDPGHSICNGKAKNFLVKCTKDEKETTSRPVPPFSSISQGSAKDGFVVPVPSLGDLEIESHVVLEKENLQMVNEEPVKNSSIIIVQGLMAETQTSEMGHTREDDGHRLMKQLPKKVLDRLNEAGCSGGIDTSSLNELLASPLSFSNAKSIPMTAEQLVCGDADRDYSGIVSTNFNKRTGGEEQNKSSKKTKIVHAADIAHVSEHPDRPAEIISETLAQPVLNYEQSPFVRRSILKSAKVLVEDPAAQGQYLELSHSGQVSEFGVNLAEMQGSAEVWTEQLKFADSCLSFSDSIVVEPSFVDELDRVSLQGKNLQNLRNSMLSEVPLEFVPVVPGQNSDIFDAAPSEVPLTLVTVNERKSSEGFSNQLTSEDPLNCVSSIAAVLKRPFQGIEISKPKQDMLTSMKDLPDNGKPFSQEAVPSEMVSETVKASQASDVRQNAFPSNTVKEGVSLVECLPVSSVAIHVTLDGDATLNPVVSHPVGGTNMFAAESPLEGHADATVENETVSLQGLQDKGIHDSSIKQYDNITKPVAGLQDSRLLHRESLLLEVEVSLAETESPNLQGFQDKSICDSPMKQSENADPVDSSNFYEERLALEADVAIAETGTQNLQGIQDDVCHSGTGEYDKTANTVVGISDPELLQRENVILKAEPAEHLNTWNDDTKACVCNDLEEVTPGGTASEILETECGDSNLIQLDAELEHSPTRADKMKMTCTSEYLEVDKVCGRLEICEKASVLEKDPTTNESVGVDSPCTSQIVPVTLLGLRDADDSLGITLQGQCAPSGSKDQPAFPPISEQKVLQPLVGDPSESSETSKDSAKRLIATMDVADSAAPAPLEGDSSPHLSELKTSLPQLVFLDYNVEEVPLITSSPALIKGSKNMQKESTVAPVVPPNLTSTSIDVILSPHSSDVKSSRLPLALPDHKDLDVHLEILLRHRPVTDAQQVQLRSQILIYGALLQGLLPEESCMSLAFMDTRAAIHAVPKVQTRDIWEKTWQIAAKSHNKSVNTRNNAGENYKRAALSSMSPLPSGLLQATSNASVAMASASFSMSPSMLPSAVRSPVFDARFASNAGLRSFATNCGADFPTISNFGIRSSLAVPLQTPNNVPSVAVPPGMLHSESLRGMAGFQAPLPEPWQWGVGSYLLQSQALPFSVPLSSAAWWFPSSYSGPPVLGNEIRSVSSPLGFPDHAPQGVTEIAGSSLQLISPFVKSSSGSCTSTSNADLENSGKGARARRTRLLEARSRKRVRSDNFELSAVSEGVDAPDRLKENSVSQRGQVMGFSSPPEIGGLRVVEGTVASSLEVRKGTSFKSPVGDENSSLMAEVIDISAERSSLDFRVPLAGQNNTGDISKAASTLEAKSNRTVSTGSVLGPSSFSKAVSWTDVNRSFFLEDRNANGKSTPMDLMLTVGQSELQAIPHAATEILIQSSLTPIACPDTSKEIIPTSKVTNSTLQVDGDGGDGGAGGTASACRSYESLNEAGNLEEARRLAESVELEASSALQISQSFWNEVYSQNNADRSFDKDAEVAFLAVTLTSAVSAVKAAAAAGRVAYETALQAKDIASELFSLGASESSRKLHNETMACIDVSGKTPADKPETTLSSSKKAHILDGIVQAIDLAVKAASQAGAIITLGDPIPFNLRTLSETGLENFLKNRSTVGMMQEVDLKGIQSQQEMQISLVKGKPEGVDDVLPSNALEAGAHFGKEEHGRPHQKRLAIGEPNATGEYKKNSEAQKGHADPEVHTLSMPTSMKTTTRSEAITAVAELILEAEEEKLRQSRESVLMEQETLRRIIEDIKENALVEVIQEENGNREGWFKAIVRKVDNMKVLVTYDDLYDEEENCQLEEWVPLPASPHDPPRVRPLKDEGTRKRRRSTIGNQMWLVGDHVDALLNDGWWEGVVKSVNEEDEKLVMVMFPDGQTSVIKSWNLRPALTWRDCHWVPRTVSLQDNLEQDAGGTLKRQKSQKGFVSAHAKDNSKLSHETNPCKTERHTYKGRQVQEAVLGMKSESLTGRPSQKAGSTYDSSQNVVSLKGSNVKGTALEVSKATFGVRKTAKKRKSMVDIEKARPMDTKAMKGSPKNEMHATGEKLLVSSGVKTKGQQALGVQLDEKEDASRNKSMYKNSDSNNARYPLPRIRGAPTTVNVHSTSTKSSNMEPKKKHGILRNPFSRGVGISKKVDNKSLPYHFRRQLDNLDKLQNTNTRGETGLKTDDSRRSSRILHPSFKLLEGLQSAPKPVKNNE